MSESPVRSPGPDFVRAVVQQDLDSGRTTQVRTRFPPEPNGYLHIGHAKSICLNFGVARDFGGVCHMRFDDTNPAKEDPEFVDSIQRDIRWLGFEWGKNLYFASDYFDQLYAYAVALIEAGKAYVCSQNESEMRETRGTVTTPGTHSPYRGRSVAENLDLLTRMRAGEFPDGAHVVRAKIDMANPNMKMRDPPFYRIRHVHHDRTGDAWCIYPLYDYAHCLSDAIEGISHSVCTLEFENNRELYDWFIAAVGISEPRPRQYEFARLALTYNLMSKRKLLSLVTEGHVNGWDDPRMPTISGMRRLGYTPEAIRAFCDRIGVAKANSTVDIAVLEHSVRDDLNRRSPRAMGVLRPLKLIIEGYEGTESFEVPASPPGVSPGTTRTVPFSRELYIDREDFSLDPPEGFRRLAPDREVRLRGAYLVTCTSFETRGGVVSVVYCTYDPATRGGDAPDGRKVSGTLHWVDAATSLNAEIRVYDRLFSSPTPEVGPEGTTFLDRLNPSSLVSLEGRVEASLGTAAVGDRFQLERLGYFRVDEDSTDGLVLNRTITLRDTWAKAPPTKKKKASKKTKAKPPATEGTNATDAVDADPGLKALRDAIVAAGAETKAATNLVANDLRRVIGDGDPGEVDAGAVARLLGLQADGTVSGGGVRKVLGVLVRDGGDPAELVDTLGLRAVEASALGPIVAQVLADHPGEVERFRGGETKLMGFLMGRVMRAAKGKADPKAASAMLREQLG